MNRSETKKMIKRLERAYVCCSECGDRYGVYSVGRSSIWNDCCDICDKIGPVTEARDYAYFVTGLKKLRLELQNHSSSN